MPFYGVRGWDFFTVLEWTEQYLEQYGSSFVDGVFVDSTGFGWAVNEMVEHVVRVLIPGTADHHEAYIREGHVPEGEIWTWEMTLDSLWEWEMREGCTTDYVYGRCVTWERLERHEMARIVEMALGWMANDDEILWALEMETVRYDGGAL